MQSIKDLATLNWPVFASDPRNRIETSSRKELWSMIVEYLGQCLGLANFLREDFVACNDREINLVSQCLGHTRVQVQEIDSEESRTLQYLHDAEHSKVTPLSLIDTCLWPIFWHKAFFHPPRFGWRGASLLNEPSLASCWVSTGKSINPIRMLHQLWLSLNAAHLQSEVSFCCLMPQEGTRSPNWSPMQAFEK